MKSTTAPFDSGESAIVSDKVAESGAQSEPVSAGRPSSTAGVIIGRILPVIIVAGALTIGAVLIKSPPQVPRAAAPAIAPVVDAIEPVPETVAVDFEAYGTVVPSREIRVSPEVSGRIIDQHAELKQGGLLKQGELLAKVDPTDYEIAVAQAEADLNVAEHELARAEATIKSLQSRGRQLDVEIDYLQWNADRYRSLAERDSAGEAEARDAMTRLRSQQAARATLDAEIVEQERAVATAAARVQVAQRQLDSARIALGRTQVTVPFDAVVMQESVEVGQLVTPQNTIATLVANDRFWVEASVPVHQLTNIRFATDQPDNPSNVEIRRASDRSNPPRIGIALRPLVNLDPLGRMSRLLVSLPDPLGLTEARGSQPVLLGSYVSLRIAAGEIDGVVAIPRKAIRENDRVWVRDAEGKFAIRTVQVAWRRESDVLVYDQFETGDKVIVSHLSSAIPGMPLRLNDGKDLQDRSEAESDQTTSANPTTPDMET